MKADSWMPVRLTFSPGDANFTGDVDVLDLQTIINYIFKDPWTLFNRTAANLWNDETINVQDVIGMVNTLMNSNKPTKNNGFRHIKKNDFETLATVGFEKGGLVIHNTVPIAAFEVFVNGCSSASICQSLQAMGMVCEARAVDGGWHIVGYSLSGGLLPVGENIIVSVEGGEPVVEYVMLSDKNASEIPIIISETVTAINPLDDGMDVEANSQGIVLHTSHTLDQFSWSIYDLSGSLMHMGEASNVLAGSHLLYHRDNLRGKPLIVKVKADGGKEIIKKIMIK